MLFKNFYFSAGKAVSEVECRTSKQEKVNLTSPDCPVVSTFKSNVCKRADEYMLELLKDIGFLEELVVDAQIRPSLKSLALQCVIYCHDTFNCFYFFLHCVNSVKK